MPYVIFCHTPREPIPVYAGEEATEGEARLKAYMMISKARVAKAMGDIGDKYLADIFKVTVENEDGDTIITFNRDESGEEENGQL